MSNLIRIAAALIDDSNGRVFLVRKRGTGVFMQAGGKIDSGESALQALVRELSEELNFKPPQADSRFLGIFRSAAANEVDHQLEAHLFHVRADNYDFTIGAELEEAVWVSFEAADRLCLAPLTRDHVLPLARSFDYATAVPARGRCRV